jgi:4-carboxymuconolactone decarboxylase
MTPRITPVTAPYPPELETMLSKWMPPGSAREPLALFRTLARHDTMMDRMRPLGSGLLGRGVLAPRVRELLILRTCARCGAEYEWGVHVAAFSAAVGLDDATVRRTVLGSPDEVAAGAGADDVVLCVADELHDGGAVSDATWSAVSERFDEKAMLEMFAVAGFYHLISFVANGARVELEPWAARFPIR